MNESERDAKIQDFLGRITWLGRSGFLIRKGDSPDFRIYIDPYSLPPGLPVATIVLLTHNHPDHCSVPDVDKISKPETIVVGPADCVCRFRLNQLPLHPGQTKSVLGIPVTGVWAYTLQGTSHPKTSQWLGFVLELEGLRIYHAGDTDRVPELAGLRADVALLPVSGVLGVEEAVQLARQAGARMAVPMHFEASSNSQAEEFMRLAGEIGIGTHLPMDRRIEKRPVSRPAAL